MEELRGDEGKYWLVHQASKTSNLLSRHIFISQLVSYLSTYFLYLMPVTLSPVPLLLSWGSVEPIEPKFLHLWELISAFLLHKCLFGYPKNIIFTYRCLYRCSCYLQLFGNCWKVHNCFWGISWIAWILPWYQGQKGTVSKDRPFYSHAAPINS